MKLGKLIIKNFLTIADAEIDLADRGLVLIQGDNRDDTSAISNGAGKSTIADAVCWCLFGTTARGETGDAIVNNVAGKSCFVSLTIHDGADEYWVTRYRKHVIGKNSVQFAKINKAGSGALSADLTKGTDKLTQVEIEKVLGSTYDVFRASIYAGQESMPDLPGMTDKNLKMLVEEAAGTVVLERAYEIARERLNKSTVAKMNADDILDRRVEASVGAKERLAGLDIDVSMWEEAHKKQLETIREALDLASASADIILREIKALPRGASVVDAELAECDRKIAAVAGELIKERKLSADLGAKTSQVEVMKAKLDTLKVQHGRAKAALGDAEHKLGCACDECGRPLTADEIAPLKVAAQKRVDTIKTEFDATHKLAASALIERKALSDSLEAHRASMTDTTKESAQRASLQRELIALRNAGDLHAARVREVNDLRARFERVSKEINPLIKRVEAGKLEVTNFDKKIEEAVEAREKAILEHAEDEITAKVFSPTGARGEILDDVTPYLNDRTAKYLSTLSDGNITATWTTMIRNAKGELREKFAIEVSNEKGGKSFGLISGGEKRKVRIAAALALQDLVSTRATKQIELFIGDEIDDALDAAGIERLMTILEEKAGERGSVFMISHSDLKNWVSQQLTVIKEGGVSRIEETIE